MKGFSEETLDLKGERWLCNQTRREGSILGRGSRRYKGLEGAKLGIRGWQNLNTDPPALIKPSRVAGPDNILIRT